MNTTSSFSMDWSNIQIKAKDVLLYSFYLVPAIYFINQVTNAVERQGEKITELQNQVTELKNEDKGNTKDFQLFIQNFQNQINTTNTRVSLVEQKVDIIEKSNK